MDDATHTRTWEKFKEVFYEKPYEKNIVGNLRDFGFFCYHSKWTSFFVLFKKRKMNSKHIIAERRNCSQ
jgi:hypothetical protein